MPAEIDRGGVGVPLVDAAAVATPERISRPSVSHARADLTRRRPSGTSRAKTSPWDPRPHRTHPIRRRLPDGRSWHRCRS